MNQHFETIEITTLGPGLYEFTDEAARSLIASGLREGLLTCFIRHTSASLLIQENADPDVLADLEILYAPVRVAGSETVSAHDRRP